MKRKIVFPCTLLKGASQEMENTQKIAELLFPHIQKTPADFEAMYPPRDLPEGARVFRAFDYGLDMLACLWISLDRFGRAYVFREVHASNLIVSDAARLIAENSPEAVSYTHLTLPTRYSV